MPPKTPRQSGASLPGVATPNLPTYAFGDIVLAKVKGHPAWPARIVDPYVSPLNLRDERKIAQKNSYLVKFFKTADYAWMNAKEMSILEPTEIQAFINNPNKKGADLKAAYQIALAPQAWEAELEARLAADVEDYNALEIDELETVDAEGAEKATSAQSKQKRKRPSETKSPAVSTKKRKSVDARATNVPAQASATPEPPAAAPAAKKRGKKKEEPVVPVDGESVVREWRHRLQRLFLSKTVLTEKMMPEIDGVFTDIEQFEMKTEWLTSSKLGKVLKRVGILEERQIPLEAQYSIRARARALQEKWRSQLGLGEEPTHRSKTVDGNDAAKANASVDNGNGKENTDPTGTKKVEEAMVNGKEATKPSDPEDMKMDEDDPTPVKVAEVDEETNTAVEPAPVEEAKISEPESEAPEASPPQANGNHTAVNGHSEPVEAGPEAVDTQPEAVNGEAEPAKDEAPADEDEASAVQDEAPAVPDEAPAVQDEAPAAQDEASAVQDEASAVQDEASAVQDEASAVQDEAPAVPDEAPVVQDEEAPAVQDEAPAAEDEAAQDEGSAVNGEAEAVKDEAPVVNGEPEAANEKTEETDDKPEAVASAEPEAVSEEPKPVSEEPKPVNGDHASPMEEDEASKPTEQAEQDVEMASTTVEPQPAAKAAASELNDEDEQMDCTDTPEPPAVENSATDKEIAA
ncbi:hypothetical protein PtA15_12A415 [Puccinia triticina]|uniref:PWWP domain-containing protein n=1 Tax=Puccinia triticina TaxID=208348 RepID=A0ABY7CYP0_9BASI|nr:uncharacterized protein PtA15_12A415 [Puccinia triticina]WAQ90426.1 hypothetical protein PtA15_12A415 [Puccinia triticina]